MLLKIFIIPNQSVIIERKKGKNQLFQIIIFTTTTKKQQNHFNHL